MRDSIESVDNTDPIKQSSHPLPEQQTDEEPRSPKQEEATEDIHSKVMREQGKYQIL